MLELANYTLTDKIYEGQETLVFRGYRNRDQLPVAVKFQSDENPSAALVARTRHEHAILRDLAIPGVVKTYGLENYNNRVLLLLEDVQGCTLSDLLAAKKLDLKTVLQISISLAETLDAVHRAGIIHKDIKPRNIFVRPEDGSTTLIDFGISSRLQKEVQRLQPPDTLSGTLAYLSPEQTGRMNRSIDTRTDLYSLGVTIYQMLTSVLPFQTKDLMELVHSHIARKPPSVRELNSEIPDIVSDIVMKLLEKAAEDRYQSARGLKADLEECLSMLTTTGIIAPFPLGRHDKVGVFRLPQKLYGRDAEVAALLDAWNRVGDGKAEFLLIKGYAGIGKSALVNEIHKGVAHRSGFYIASKFDQMSRNVPYSAIASALRDLIRQLLSQPSDSIEVWRTKLTKALSTSGQLILDLIPELAHIIGPQPPVPPLPPIEAQNRFTMVFQAFLSLFTTASHPLVLFLDDLQWADAASLELLKLIFSDPEQRHFLLISAFRDNEVDEHHPMTLALDEIKKMGASISVITLKPLDSQSLLQLVAETVNSTPEEVAPLAEILNAKTHGNPFFATQLLQTLYEEKHIFFDADSCTWKWNDKEIGQMAVADNVVDFMSGRIRLFSEQAQEAIKLASCIGHEFNLSTLATIWQRSRQETANALAESLSEGIIVPLDEAYRFFFHRLADSGEHADLQVDVAYKFLHDRVQQAAYSLIPQGQVSELHLRIGWLLKQQAKDGWNGEHLFQIVNHLNRGASLISAPDEKRSLAEMNLAAGWRAKTSRAYLAAADYFSKGVALLEEGSWESQYGLTYGLHLGLAEAEFLNRRVEQAEEIFGILKSHVKAKDDLVRIHQLHCEFLTALGQLPEAVKTLTHALAALGLVLPEDEAAQQAMMGAELGEIEATMAGRQIKDLINLPELTDTEQLPLVKLLTSLFTPTMVNPTLSALVAVKLVNLSLKYGHCEGSAYAYASYGIILIMVMKRYKEANEYVELAIQLLDTNPRWGTAEWKCKVYEMYVGNVRFFRNAYRGNLPWIEKVHQTGIEAGDYAHMSYVRCDLFVTRFAVGDELDQIYDDCQKSLALMQRTKDGLSTPCLIAAKQFVAALTGRTKSPNTLSDDSFEDKGFAEQWEAVGLTPVAAWYYVHKLEIVYLHEDYQGALELVAHGDRTVESAAFWYLIIEHPFYAVLTLAALYPTSSPQEQAVFKQRIADYVAKLEVFAENSPENYKHKYLLARAEQARISESDVGAMALYDEAIEAARENDCLRDEALACELAGRFHFAHKRTKIGRVYMSDAHYGYVRWGASIKAQLIVDKYPFIIARGTTAISANIAATTSSWTSLTTTTGKVGALFDTTTIIRTAQAINSEIVLSKLLRRLIKIVIENAGAQASTLFISREGELFAEASITVEPDVITVGESIAFERCNHVPRSVIQYVARTKEAVVLGDATQDSQFAKDAYIGSNQPKSILCVPLIHQGRLIGVLYLEHRMTSDVFTPTRVELLQVVSSQAAIAIENAMLYANLQRANETLEAQVAQRTEELRKTLAELWSEMDLARKIQTVLLPENAQMGDCEIAAIMQPATEVGGDYYDMIHIGGKTWIFMGDVSGHGVSAGLIMMMVQTAVRTLVLNLGKQAAEPSPARILAMVNAALCGNLERIGKGQYMTIVGLCIDGPTIHFAGAHLDILVHRQALNRVDCIPTEGAWIGIVDDITDILADSSFELAPGDTMLLFTDGITEAIRTDKELLGIDNLQKLFAKAMEQPKRGPEVIRTILDQMKDYSMDRDDVTMMVVQRAAASAANGEGQQAS